MSTEIATTEEKFELIPQKQKEYLSEIDTILRQYHGMMQEADYAYSYVLKELAATRVENRLRELLSHKKIVEIFRQLANTKRGYSVAEKRGVDAIDDDCLVDCMIDASMKGMRFRGNEFTIIAKGVYANKEAYKRFLREMNCSYQCYIGVPDKKVLAGHVFIDAAVDYHWRGEHGRLEYRNTENMDQRIVLKSYDTDSPDLHRGKAESKLLRRLFAHLTGADLPCFADFEDNVVDGHAEQVDAPKIVNSKQTFDENGLPTNK